MGAEDGVVFDEIGGYKIDKENYYCRQFYFQTEIFTPAVETADGVDAIEPDAETLESLGCCIVKDGCLKRFPVVPSNSSLKS